AARGKRHRRPRRSSGLPLERAARSMVCRPVARTPPAGRASDLAERDRLRAFPESASTQLFELLLPLDERRKVVRPQVSGLRREGAVPVGKEQLGFALTARVESELAGVRVRGRILRPDPEIPVSPWDPVRLAAPAAVDDSLVKGEDASKRSHRLGCELFLEACEEAEVVGR